MFLAVFLITVLILVSDVQLFLYPPSYAFLRLEYLLSPIAYLAGFVIFRFVVKPCRQKGDVNFNGFVPDKLQSENNPSGIIEAACQLVPAANGNSVWNRILNFFSRRKILRENLDLHCSNRVPVALAADRNSTSLPSQRKLACMTTDDLRQNLLLWQGREKHYRRVLKDVLLDYKRYWPHWVEAAKFHMRLRAIYFLRQLGFRPASLVGIKSRP